MSIIRRDPKPHEVLDEEKHGDDASYGGRDSARSRREFINRPGRDRRDPDHGEEDLECPHPARRVPVAGRIKQSVDSRPQRQPGILGAPIRETFAWDGVI